MPEVLIDTEHVLHRVLGSIDDPVADAILNSDDVTLKNLMAVIASHHQYLKVSLGGDEPISLLDLPLALRDELNYSGAEEFVLYEVLGDEALNSIRTLDYASLPLTALDDFSRATGTSIKWIWAE